MYAIGRCCKLIPKCCYYLCSVVRQQDLPFQGCGFKSYQTNRWFHNDYMNKYLRLVNWITILLSCAIHDQYTFNQCLCMRKIGCCQLGVYIPLFESYQANCWCHNDFWIFSSIFWFVKFITLDLLPAWCLFPPCGSVLSSLDGKTNTQSIHVIQHSHRKNKRKWSVSRLPCWLCWMSPIVIIIVLGQILWSGLSTKIS